MKTLGLKTKFLSGALGLVALLGLAIAILVRLTLTDKLEAELQKRGVSIATHIAEILATPLLTGDILELQITTLAHQESEKDIEYIFVEDAEGRVLAHTFGRLFPADLRKVRTKSGSGQAAGSVVRPLRTEKGRVFDIAAPVLKGELAMVHVGMSAEPVRKGVADIIRRILLITAAVLSGGGVLAVAFTNRITKPLVEFMEAVRIAGTGSRGLRVPVKTGDEIGRLAGAFNTMMDDLQATTVSRAHLERLVEERTAEILRLGRQNELILNSAGEGIFGLDKEGVITFINPAAAGMIGWTAAELIGRPSHETFHHSRPDGSRYPWEDCPAKKAFVSGSLDVVKDGVFWRNNGTNFPVEYVSTPMMEDGRITGAVVVFKDISERKQAEEELRSALMKAREQKAKFESIIAAIGDGINIQDREYRILYQNEVAIGFFGDHIGEYCYKAFRNQETVCERCHLTMAFADGQVHTLEQKRTAERGTSYYEITSSPLRGADGRIVAGIELVRDVTERRKLLEQLEALNLTLTERVREEIEKNRAREQLMQLQNRHAAMGEMIDNIAHQWRQPLNNLGLIIQGMQKKFSSNRLTAEKMQEQTKIGMSLIRYMSQTISDFTNFLRHDKAIAQFRVRDVVATALAVMETSLNRNAVRVFVDVPDDVCVTGYRNEYTQVVVNILNNARDILAERRVAGPEIRLRASRKGSNSVLTIGDNGGGIANDLIGRIFLPNVTTKAHSNGTGIGLSMSKMIIEDNMRGRLSVSNIGEGAEFRIEVRHG